MTGFNPRFFFRFFIILLGTAISATAVAQQNQPMLDRNKLSLGFGISDNSVRRTEKTGFQIFGAYRLDQVNIMEGVRSSAEFGVIDYGFRRDSTGIWANYVIEGGISDGVNWLARAGMDFGDDSGLMFGAGIGFDFRESADFRIEYVVRDDVDSLQFNLLFGM